MLERFAYFSCVQQTRLPIGQRVRRGRKHRPIRDELEDAVRPAASPESMQRLVGRQVCAGLRAVALGEGDGLRRRTGHVGDQQPRPWATPAARQRLNLNEST